jgi:YD repeat-containing protein
LRTCQHGSEASRLDCKTDTPDTKPAVSPQPAGTRYRTELHFDANRNVIREDIEDKFVRYQSEDPSETGYGHFSPTGSHSTANVPMRKGHAGRQLRPGWFSNLRAYDLLDNVIEEDEDATGSHPDHLITRYEYDANENLIQVVQPEGNTVDYDYDERNLRIATKVGDAPDTLAITIMAYDGNGNLFFACVTFSSLLTGA